jgi:biopolymer transport protein ExbD
MKFYTRQKRFPSVIIVSLIDILAILLIFVIVTTTFKRDQPALMIKLPGSSTAAPAPSTSDPTLLSVEKNGNISIAEGTHVLFKADAVTASDLDPAAQTAVDMKTALLELEHARPNIALALQVDTSAPFGVIVRVLDILKEAGVKNIPAFMEKK